jgi:ATP-binding cassette, subfamily B, bacterial
MSEFAVSTPWQSDYTSPTRWILSHMRRHGLLLAVMFIGAFGNAALAAVVPVFVGIAFDAVLAEPPQTALIGWAALGIIISQAVRSVLQFGRNFSSAVVGERMERDMREELYVSLLGKSMTFHDLQPVGDTMARATNDVHELNIMIYPGVNLVIGSLNFMLMPLLLAPRYDWALILAPLFFIVTYLLALARYMQALGPDYGSGTVETFGTLNGRLAEAIDGIEMVKGAAQETAEIDRF